MLYKYTSLSLQIKTLTIINHNGSFSKKTQNYLTLKEPANIWFIYIYKSVCKCVFIYTQLKLLQSLQSSFRRISSFCTLFIFTELFCSIWED